MQKHIATGIIAGAFLVGSAGAVLALPGLAAAADPTPTPSATMAAPSATAGTDATTTPSTPSGTTGTTTAPADGTTAGTPGDHRGHGGPGGLDADDLTAAAGALGMTEADLTTALQSGKSAADVAKDKGVDVQKVIDAIVASDKAEIAAAVAAGTMTQAQADERLANLTAHVTDEVNGVAGGPGAHGGPGGLDADDLTAAAGALGMTEADLTTALQSGKSAADVAKDKGVDVQKVIDAIVASDKAEIAAAVAAGTMTQAQADERLANLTAHVTDEVNGVAGGPGAHGGPGGQAPNGTQPTNGTDGSTGTTGA